MTTDEALTDLWLDVHDDDTPQARALALTVPMPFLPDFTPAYHPDLPDFTPQGEAR